MNLDNIEITPSPLVATLNERIGELESRIEALGSCKLPSVSVQEDGRDFEVEMGSGGLAYIEGEFTVNRVEYRLYLRAKLDELTGRWELVHLNGWRNDRKGYMTDAAKSTIATSLHQWAAPAISQALSNGGYEAAEKANLRSALVDDLRSIRDLLEDVESCDRRAAEYQARAKRHLGELSELQQVSPLAELL